MIDSRASDSRATDPDMRYAPSFMMKMVIPTTIAKLAARVFSMSPRH
ncbi:hypothetical protein ACFL0D_00510 [Thermoproteota archaeon]